VETEKSWAQELIGRHRVNTTTVYAGVRRARLFLRFRRLNGFAMSSFRRVRYRSILVTALGLLASLAGIAQNQNEAPPANAARSPIYPTVFPAVEIAPPASVPHQSATVASSAISAPPAVKNGAATPGSALLLGTGDLLDITFYNVPELNTKTRVGSNGDVYLPLVDYVHVLGLTPEEAAAVIEKRYVDGGFLKDPHITLLIDEYESQGVSVLGEVVKPGVYPVLGGQRLLDLIAAAGGYTEKAGRSIAITHRGSPDKSVTVPLSRNTTDGDNNVDVSPGDTVIVKRADIFYVVGDVGHPSGFLMDSENLTVLKAIALAGGTNHTAKLNGTRIIRRGPNGMTETPVELKKILQAKSHDIPLQAEDILFVPSSAAKQLAGRTLDVATQAASAATIVAFH
jgi:polysaccharide biosynthesis/export protein